MEDISIHGWWTWKKGSKSSRREFIQYLTKLYMHLHFNPEVYFYKVTPKLQYVQIYLLQHYWWLKIWEIIKMSRHCDVLNKVWNRPQNGILYSCKKNNNEALYEVLWNDFSVYVVRWKKAKCRRVYMVTLCNKGNFKNARIW